MLVSFWQNPLFLWIKSWYYHTNNLTISGWMRMSNFSYPQLISILYKMNFFLKSMLLPTLYSLIRGFILKPISYKKWVIYLPYKNCEGPSIFSMWHPQHTPLDVASFGFYSLSDTMLDNMRFIFKVQTWTNIRSQKKEMAYDPSIAW